MEAITPIVQVVTGGTDWPAIVAAITTGVVGLGGILATYWQGKRGQEAASKNFSTTITAENERARLAEKRRIYAACLNALNDLAVAAADRKLSEAELDQLENYQRFEAQPEVEPNTTEAERSRTQADVSTLEARLESDDRKMGKARDAVINTISELSLIASPDVENQADSMRKQLMKSLSTTSTTEKLEFPDVPSMRKELLTAMRADLGEKE
jgi:hypothetical protein